MVEAVVTGLTACAVASGLVAAVAGLSGLAGESILSGVGRTIFFSRTGWSVFAIGSETGWSVVAGSGPWTPDFSSFSPFAGSSAVGTMATFGISLWFRTTSSRTISLSAAWYIENIFLPSMRLTPNTVSAITDRNKTYNTFFACFNLWFLPLGVSPRPDSISFSSIDRSPRPISFSISPKSELSWCPDSSLIPFLSPAIMHTPSPFVGHRKRPLRGAY